MPELPAQKRSRYENDLGLTPEDSRILSSELGLATYFECCVEACEDAGLAANWVRGNLLGNLNRDGLTIDQAPLDAETLGQIINRIKDQTISGKIAKTIFTALWEGRADSVDQYIASEGLVQVTDASALEPIVDKIIAENPAQAEQYRSGKTKLLGFFVGQVMKETAGKANPKQVNDLVKSRLG